MKPKYFCTICNSIYDQKPETCDYCKYSGGFAKVTLITRNKVDNKDNTYIITIEGEK